MILEGYIAVLFDDFFGDVEPFWDCSNHDNQGTASTCWVSTWL